MVWQQLCPAPTNMKLPKQSAKMDLIYELPCYVLLGGSAEMDLPVGETVLAPVIQHLVLSVKVNHGCAGEFYLMMECGRKQVCMNRLRNLPLRQHCCQHMGNHNSMASLMIHFPKESVAEQQHWFDLLVMDRDLCCQLVSQPKMVMVQ